MIASHITKWVLLTMVAVGIVTVSPVEARKMSREDYAKRIEDAEKYYQETMEQRDNSIPRRLMKNAKAIVIMRQYKFGFFVGGKGGYGVAFVRDEKTGRWSPPSFMKLGEVSFGFQFGGQGIDAIYLVMTDKGMESLTDSQLRFGADAGIAVGPVGRSGELKAGTTKPILSYSRSKGAYAGVSLEGGGIAPHKKANNTFYDREDLTPQEILFEGKVSMPDEAKNLVQMFEKYSVEVED